MTCPGLVALKDAEIQYAVLANLLVLLLASFNLCGDARLLLKYWNGYAIPRVESPLQVACTYIEVSKIMATTVSQLMGKLKCLLRSPPSRDIDPPFRDQYLQRVEAISDVQFL